MFGQRERWTDGFKRPQADPSKGVSPLILTASGMLADVDVQCIGCRGAVPDVVGPSHEYIRGLPRVLADLQRAHRRHADRTEDAAREVAPR